MTKQLLNRALGIAILSCALVIPSSAQQQEKIKDFRMPSLKMPSATVNAKTKNVKPSKQWTCSSSYLWINDEWVKMGEIKQSVTKEGYIDMIETTSYDETGKFAFASLDTYELNEYGMFEKAIAKIKYAAEDEWTNSSRIELTYDEICHDVFTERSAEYWDTDHWIPLHDFDVYNEIKRDDKGRLAEFHSWNTKDKEKAQMGYICEYENGKTGTSTIKFLAPLENNFETALTYMTVFNIKWLSTDEQYLKINPDPLFIFNEDPNNLPESYDSYMFDMNGTKMDSAYVRNIYDDQYRIVQNSVMAGNKTGRVNINEWDIDENGSFASISYETNDNNGNKVYDEGEEQGLEYCEHIFYFLNEMGDLKCIEYYGYNPITKAFDIKSRYETYENTYNEDNTLAEVVFTAYDSGGNVNNKHRTVYSDYIDFIPTGINGAVAEDNGIVVSASHVLVPGITGMPYVICDMQGRVIRSAVADSNMIDISYLSGGLFILNVNNRSVKLMQP